MELGLLILESVLLFFTIALLIFSIKEGRGRDRLLEEVNKATKTLTRHSYFIAVMDAMMDAEKEIFGIITGRKPSREDHSMTKAIIADIEKLTSQGIKIKYIMPKFPDRLYIAHAYSKAGADVRLGGCSAVNDLRYIVTDKNDVVVGIPEKIGEKEATRKGYRMPSEDMAQILKNNFYECWDGSFTLEEYVRDVVTHTGATLKALSQEVGIHVDELKKISGEKK